MKNKFTQKLLITMIALIMTISTINVKAMEVYVQSDGYSYPTRFGECSANGEGCASFTEFLEIRVTISDENKEQVLNTRSVDIASYNPYNGEPATQLDNTVNPHFPYSTSDKAQLTPWEDNFSFTGSSITSQEPNTQWIPKWQIYLGYGDLGYAEQDDFSTYSNHRIRFIEFAKNLNRKQILINESVGSVNFIDFVLKTTGFVDTYGIEWKDEKDKWNASSNVDFLRKLGKEFKEGKKYYILVEPIYWMGVQSNGSYHQARGTAKQLARFAANNSNQIWFWPPYNSQLAKNYFCNFIDKSGALGLSTQYEYYCWNDSNFNFISNISREIDELYEEESFFCDKQGGLLRKGWIGNRLGQATENICEYGHYQTETKVRKKQETLSALQNNFERDLYNKLADVNSALGVNVINISETLIPDPDTVETIENTCHLNVSSCEGNNFTYSSILSSDDLFNCVYPSDKSGMDKNEMEQLATHYENTDLWCYDDVTYNFRDLKDYYQEDNKLINQNQLVPLQSGKLTVDRTCFSKKEENSISLNRIFETDDGTYQNEFTLNFLGKDYKYKKGTKYQLNSDGSKKTSVFNYTKTEGESNGEKYYKYTSTFYYDYDIDGGIDGNNLSININNFNLNESLGNTNAINVNIKNSKIVKTPDGIEEKTYVNSLTTDSTSQYPNLQNAYGLGNKLYNKLNNEEKITDFDADNYNYNEKSTIEYNNSSATAIFTNKYEMNKNTRACTFTTTTSTFETKFRVISLNNPFPGRDGTSRIPGENWVNQNENNVYEYIQNNRGVNKEEVYNKEPLYTITLTPSEMIKIRGYNKLFTYTQMNLICETGTGRKCVSEFLRDNIKNLEGTCANVNSKNTTDFYTCADKTEKSGG